MRGHIVKRYKNSYTVIMNMGLDPTTGKRKQQWVSVKGTKKDAEKRLSEMLHQIDTGSFMAPGKITVADFLDRWLKDYAKPNLAPRTAEGYESIVRQHLVPKLGSIPLTQLKPEHLQKYYSETLSGGRCGKSSSLTAQTVRHHHTALHKALQTAVEWGILSRNVADAVKAPRAERPEMRTWGEEEIGQFLQAAKKTPHYALFYSALFTGMRRSELLALRWQDVDLTLSQVHVSRSVHQVRDRGLVFRSTKTAKGRRPIDLPPSAARVLAEHREKQKLERLLVGIPLNDENLVFSHVDATPLRPNSITRAWVMLAARAGLKVIRLHDARHTHASIMLKQGIHPKIVQERLGHSTIATTLDIYSHVAPGLQEAAAKRFDEAFTVRYNEPARVG